MYTFLSLYIYMYIYTYAPFGLVRAPPSSGHRNEVLPGSGSRAPIIKIQWDATNSRARARTQSKYVRVDNYIYIDIHMFIGQRERDRHTQRNISYCLIALPTFVHCLLACCLVSIAHVPLPITRFACRPVRR